ncbi:MAG: phosphoserine phosphatase SerB [Hyphomicrobiaceae bacterium]|nr:phosphoserine phosphatase SerB [Hyphomicrobiaceae bacterium]
MQQFAFVFTCSPFAPCLSEDLLQQKNILVNFNVSDELHWLAPNVACEILTTVTMERARSMLISIRKVLSEQPIDVNAVVANDQRQKSLVIADMDSTIIKQECIDELGVAAGVGDKIQSITEQAMQGKLNFDDALRARVKLLHNLPVTIFGYILNEHICLNSGALEFIQTMRLKGAYCVLVSGGFTAFTAIIAERVGFNSHKANSFEIDNGKLTGRILDPILNGEAKVKILQDLLADRNLSKNQCLVVGDGANDIAMIKHAGLGCAFRAKPAVNDNADVIIRHCDLTALLYLQGFSFNSFYSER